MALNASATPIADVMVSTGNSSSPEEPGFNPCFVVFFLLSFTLATFIIVSNGLFIVACWKHPALRTISTIYVHSLAVADMLLGCSLYIQGVYFITTSTRVVHTVKYLCLTTLSITSTGLTASLLGTMLVAIDRYVYIVHPYSYCRLINASRTKRIVCLAWLLSALYGMFPFYYNKYRDEDGCSHSSSYSQYTVSRVAIFLTASFATGFCHASIHYTALMHIRRIYPKVVIHRCGVRSKISRSFVCHSTGQMKPTKTTFGHMGATIRLVKTFFLVYVFFFCSWLPGMVVYVTGTESKAVLAGLAILAQFNSALNVFVYVMGNKQFKEAILNLLNCRTRTATVANRVSQEAKIVNRSGTSH